MTFRKIENDYFIDNISEFGNYLRRVDRIIEYNNNVGSFQENEKLMQKYAPLKKV